MSAKITDEQLLSDYHHWLDHYIKNGDKHYEDTPDWKISEMYYDMILDRILEHLPEMTDEENNEIINRLANLV